MVFPVLSRLALAVSALSAVTGCSGPPTANAPGHAADAPSSQRLATLVQTVTEGRALPIQQFEGPGGLIGLVIQGGDVPATVVWATAKADYLIFGNVFDGQRNLTTVAQAHFAPSTPPVATATPPAMNKEQFYTATAAADGVTVGDGHRPLYVYFDPGCGHCKLLYRALPASLTDQHDVAVHWIPVTLGQTPESSAGLLTDDPKQLRQAMRSGAVPPSTDPGKIESINHNTALLRQSGRAATPTLVYRDEGGAVQVISGRPGQQALKTLLGTIQPVMPPVAAADNTAARG